MRLAAVAKIIIQHQQCRDAQPKYHRSERSGQRIQRSDASGGQGGGGGGGVGGSRASSPTHAKRKARERDAFDSKRSEQVKLYQSSFPSYQQWFSAETAKAVWQERIDAEWVKRRAAHRCGSGAGTAECLNIKTRPVQLFSDVGAVVMVDVPMGRCSVCKEWVDVEAYAVGCAPATPVMPGVWYSLPLLDLFRYFNLKHGLSADGE